MDETEEMVSDPEGGDGGGGVLKFKPAEFQA